MIWLAVAVLMACAVAPVVWTSWAGRMRGRRESALALHRGQLLELERDLAERRIGAQDYQTARLEVQRRLLAAADSEDAPAQRRSRAPLLGLLLVPVGALALYWVGGRPDLAGPAATRPAPDAAAADAQMIEQLRGVLARLDPHSEQAMQGNLLLASAEESRGHDAAAAVAWKAALEAHFDPELAARAAEALTRVAGQVTPEAAGLYRRALAAAPAGVPWRSLVEQRLAGVR